MCLLASASAQRGPVLVYFLNNDYIFKTPYLHLGNFGNTYWLSCSQVVSGRSDIFGKKTSEVNASHAVKTTGTLFPALVLIYWYVYTTSGIPCLLLLIHEELHCGSYYIKDILSGCHRNRCQ